MTDHLKFTYNIDWLIEKFDTGEKVKYLFFWGHTQPPGEDVGKFIFSQWFELAFEVGGIVYKTAEHWMMASKALLFEDPETFSKIIASNTPGEAKKLGRLVRNFNEEKWLHNRMDIVVKGNIQKFGQNPKAKEYLLNTKDRVLVEASPRDQIWGIGISQNNEGVENPYNWRGQNLLGFALMEARDFLARSSK